MADLSEYLAPPEVKAGSKAILIQAHCLHWMAQAPAASIHAIVTDPPYGVKEYHPVQLAKKEAGKGGLWRIPPSFDGHTRSPVPRFTALNAADRQAIVQFFEHFGRQAYHILKPGGHLLLASNAFLSLLVFEAITRSGLEFRGEILRLVRTLRGGDRPKNYEKEFPEVCSMPRGHYEPWGLFRKPVGTLTVGECLKLHGTGGLRRLPNGKPFPDVIPSERTPADEKAIGKHPTQKPLSLMVPLVHASLPLGNGIVLDPFFGSGATIAAAERLGLASIGIECNANYFKNAKQHAEELSKTGIDHPFYLECGFPK